MTAIHEAAEALYRVANRVPCTCLKAGLWPFRPKVLVEGKPVDPPDVQCAACRALALYEAAANGGQANG